MNLKNKKILITGGATRLGEALSKALSKKGARVLIHYNASQNKALKLSKQLKTACFHADLSQVEDIKRLFSEIKKKVGKIDVLINSAAIFYPVPFLKTTEKQWNEFMNTNLKSVFFSSQEAVPLMRKNSVIINIADVGGYIMWKDYLAYCTSKAGVLALTKGLAKTLAPKIRVNAIAPGPLLLPKGYSKKYSANLTLLKKTGSPQKLAHAVCFLIENDFLTGQVIHLDGGRFINDEFNNR